MIRFRTSLALVALAFAWSFGMPCGTSAHPLGNFTVNRAIAITVSDAVELTAVLDMAEIPAYETTRELDADGDDAVSPSEGAAWAADTCARWRDRIEVTIDGRGARLTDAVDPALTFPAGAGGLETLRLECHWALGAGGTGPHRLTLRDATIDDRAGWREIVASAAGGAVIEDSDVPSRSETGLLTAYPEDRLAAPPDVRAAGLTFTLGAASGVAAAEAGRDGARRAATDPLAALIGGELSPIVVALALVLSVGLGAAHALSPGHGKTLVAAYVLGAGGTARAAVQIGLWVAISHTAGVLALGIVTLVASEWLLPERLIGWLSLGSGVVVTGLGVVLLARVLRARGRLGHDRRSGHGHEHRGGHHRHGGDHRHADDDHDHAHDVPVAGELSWRAAVALGFAGGAVPSASALIVLLVAISTERLMLGVILIASFGLGMAAVLGGLAYAIARMRHLAGRSGGLASRPVVRRAVALAPVAAGIVVLVTGLAFTAAAVGQLA
jgi:ABC-type nickel/cobalt efflux system permease component RcnA